MAPSGGQICNKCKRCHVVAKFNPSHGVNFWVRCASGNVWDMFQVKLAKGHLWLSFQVGGVLLYSFQVKLAMGHLCNIFQVGEVKAEQLKRADGSGD